MRYRISEVNAVQFGKIAATIYGSIALLISPIFILVSAIIPPPPPPSALHPHASGPHPLPLWVVLVFPVLYGALGFVGSWGAASIYNLVARWIGGLEITLEPQRDDDAR